MKQSFLVMSLLCSVSAAAFGQSAAAQTTTAQPADPVSEAQQTSKLDDIVVTATRRSESLQAVPLAVTAFTAKQLETAGVDSASLLPQVTPGLVFNRNASVITPVLRGVGASGGGPGNEAPIATYIDGVYQPDTSGTQLDLLKISRIEVLRGPQGTLFGRNATGGLLNIITPDPTFDPQGEIHLRYGRFNERSARFYGSTGLTDRVAADLSALYYEDDGHVRDIIRGGRVGDRRTYAARAKLLFEANENLTFKLTVGAYDTDDQSFAVGQPLNGNTIGRAIDPNIMLPTGPRQYAGDIAITTGEGQNVTFDVEYDMGGVRLESTTAFVRSEAYFERDTDSSPAFTFPPISNQIAESYSQELRALSEGEGPITWIAGLYGFYSTSTIDPLLVTPTLVLNPTLHTRSIAAFGDVTWHVNEQFNLVGGLRYTYEERDFTQRISGVEPFPKQEKSFDNWSPKVVAQYFPTPNTNIYLSYSSAFKSGVFNGQGTSPIPVDPEINNAWEAGLKARPLSWMRTNIALFNYDYTDLQVSVRSGAGSSVVLQNAGAATMQGAELELTVAPIEGLQIRTSLSFLDAKYDNLKNIVLQVPNVVDGVAVGGNVTQLFDASGTPILRAPDFSGSIGFDYTRDIGPGTLSFGANLYHSDKIRWSYEGRLNQDPYELLSAQVSYEFPSGIRVAVWGENLTDETVYDSMVPVSAGDIVTYNRPRRVGVQLDYTF